MVCVIGKIRKQKTKDRVGATGWSPVLGCATHPRKTRGAKSSGVTPSLGGKMKLSRSFGLFAIVAALLTFVSQASAQSVGGAGGVIEGAKREGTVVFYGPLNINDSQAIAKRFEEKYPFIRVEILRMSAEPLLNRIITEDKAGAKRCGRNQQYGHQRGKKSYAHRVESMKKAGAPIEWVKTINPVFVAQSPVGLAAKAPHPNAARLYLDFMLSKEEQLILRSFNRSSARNDVEPLVPEMHHSKLKLVAIDPKVAEDLNRYANEFRDIYFR